MGWACQLSMRIHLKRHNCNPFPGEAEAVESYVQSHPPIHSESDLGEERRLVRRVEKKRTTASSAQGSRRYSAPEAAKRLPPPFFNQCAAERNRWSRREVRNGELRAREQLVETHCALLKRAKGTLRLGQTVYPTLKTVELAAHARRYLALLLRTRTAVSVGRAGTTS